MPEEALQKPNHLSSTNSETFTGINVKKRFIAAIIAVIIIGGVAGSTLAYAFFALGRWVG